MKTGATVRQWAKDLPGTLRYAGQIWHVTAIDPSVEDPDEVVIHLDRDNGDGCVLVLVLVLDQPLDDELRRCEEAGRQ